MIKKIYKDIKISNTLHGKNSQCLASIKNYQAHKEVENKAHKKEKN